MSEKFKVEINLDGAAFKDEPTTELARILRRLALAVAEGRFSEAIVDSNGNSVGVASFKGGGR